MSPLFFIHIPKTAGTSFRTGAGEALGAERITCDYGAASPHTTPLVREFIYGERPDPWRFTQTCKAHGTAMVAGHVNAQKYIRLLGTTRSIVFLRSPLERLQSEYAHLVRNGTCTTGFRAFYRRREMRNRQARVLGSVPLEAIGFIGITEQYEGSLEIMNAALALDIPVRLANRAAGKPSQSGSTTEEALEEIQRLNADDFQLYNKACWLLQSRLDLTRSGQPYAHGAVETVRYDRVAGWAWWAGDRDDPVEVEIWQNQVPVARVRATAWWRSVADLCPPRGGYVGFTVGIEAQTGDTLECRVTENGQWLTESAVIVSNASTPEGTEKAPEVPKSKTVTGFVDRVTADYCAGWAFHPDAPRSPARIDVYVSGRYAGSTRAHHLREDVRAAGLHPTGLCGFWLRWPEGIRPAPADTVDVWAEGDREPLMGVCSLDECGS